ncbi:MAG: hypothetical protein OEM41_03385, partial [Ignavibacteria bacterium]|nr:hypothetical protein [Ignavibacteria bacterium]
MARIVIVFAVLTVITLSTLRENTGSHEQARFPESGVPLSPSFVFDLTGATGSLNHSPVSFDGTSFLCAAENSDSLYRLNKAGQLTARFTIPGVTGITGLAYDGQHFWVARGSPELLQIDIDQGFIVRRLSSPVPVHHVSFNNDKGALFVGGTEGDIFLIDTLSGAVRDTILEAVHAITGISATAYDNRTAGGPYLWVSARNGISSAAALHLLRLPEGLPAGSPHDLMTDIGIPNGAITGAAGGLFFTTAFTFDRPTVGGVLQSFPANFLFGYTVGDPSPIDAELVSAEYPSEFSLIPFFQISPLKLTATIRNVGTTMLTEVRLGVDIYRDNVLIRSLESEILPTLLPARIDTFRLESFTPVGTGAYIFRYYTLIRETDLVPANDTLSRLLLVTDSTLARDIGEVRRSYSISNTD